MYHYLKQLILLIAIPSFIISCTEEPANDPGTDDPPPRSDVAIKGAKIPTTQDIAKSLFTNPALNFEKALLLNPNALSLPGEVDGVGSAEQDALQQKNSNLPIQYGVGAAGITLDTTLAEAKNLLTIPIFGPDEQGQALYREELIVVWKDSGDRKPDFIIPLKGYLGSMKAGKFGDINYQTKFLDYKNLGAQGAAQLTYEMYLELEEVNDPNYNCFAAGRCQMSYGDVNQTDFRMIFPGAIIWVAKEEFQISGMLIRRDIDPGVLANNIDIKTGSILPPDMAPFTLGMTNKEVFDRINETPVKASPEVFVGTDSFTYMWNGVFYLFHRSNFANDVVTAEEQDVLYAAQVTPAYPKYLTIEGQRIIMTQTESDIRFDLEVLPEPETASIDVIDVDASTIEQKLRMNTKIRKQDSLLFASRFADFLMAQMTGEFDQVRYRTWGIQNETKNNKEIAVTIEAFHSETLKGQFIGFQVNEEQEKLDYIISGLMDPKISPFSKLTLPASTGDVDRLMVEKTVISSITNEPLIDTLTQQPKTEIRKDDVYTQLAGINLNDLIKLDEIDALGRGEATVTYMSEDPGLAGITERAVYVEEGTYNEPLFNRPLARDQGFVGVYGASLGVQVVAGPEDTLDGATYARVVSITTGTFHGQVKGLCGLGDTTDIKVSMKDTEVVASLDKAIAAQKVLDPKFECDHFRIYDDGNLGLLKEIYFPSQNIRLSFSNRAFSGVSIYMPLAGVAPAPAEVLKQEETTVEVAQ